MKTDHDTLLQRLAQDPTGASIGLTRRALPPGQVVEVPGAGPLYWLSDAAPTPQDVAWARARFEVSGMWPLLIDGDGTEPGTVNLGTGLAEGFSCWLGGGRSSDVPQLDPEELLADDWPSLIAENEANDYYEPDERVSGLAPAGTQWPGLAPATTWAEHPDSYANGMTEFLLLKGWFEHPRMVLIPAVSSSDALIAARYTLAEDYPVPGHVPGLAAVLGSWERRFGARAIALRPDTLFVSVAAPPTDRLQAAHIACEHFVFAPDNVLQNSDSFPDYVDRLIDVNLWGFWWD